MLLYSYFHPNTKPVQVTNTFPFNIENLSSSPLHIMGEIKPNLHTYELRLVIAHMTVYIFCLSLSNSLVFYLMTIEDTTISCLDLRVIKTHAHPTSCKYSHIKYNSDINSPPPLRFNTAINLYCNQYYSAFGRQYKTNNKNNKDHIRHKTVTIN